MKHDQGRWLLFCIGLAVPGIVVVTIIVAISSMLYFQSDQDIVRRIEKCIRTCKLVTIRAYWGDELTDQRTFPITDEMKQNIVVKLLPPDPPGFYKSAATKANYKFEFDCGDETIGFGYMNGLERIWITYDFLVKKGGKKINVNPEFWKFLDSLVEQAKLHILPKNKNQ